MINNSPKIPENYLCLGLDIWVSKVVQAGVRQADGGHDPLVVVVDCIRRQVASHLIAKHKAVILPEWPRFEPVLNLLGPVSPEQFHNGCSGGDRAAFAILGGD